MLITRKTSVRSLHNRGGNINDKAKEEPTVYLYGDIGGWFGIDHLEFIKDFNKIDAKTIHLRIDSGGGDIFAARAIKTCIQQHKAKVIGHIDGLCASAASFLAMGCDEIEMVEGGFLMAHNAMSFMDILGYFNKDDLASLMEDIQKEMDLHEKINDSIANDYLAKCKKTKEKTTKDEVTGWMDAETWFTAAEALDCGLIDRIYDGEPVEGSYDLSVFMKVPESLKLRNCTESKRAIEKALRGAGLSNKQAKDILLKGYKEEKEDEVHQEDVLPQPGVVDSSTPIIPDPPVVQRDVEIPVKKKDRIADLLVRAEMLAPSV
jgi:ATP-dependent Clp protease protease subunit